MFLGAEVSFSLLAQNALPNLRPPYAPKPAEQYWTNQWNLDNRNASGVRVGADLNVRGAWERTKGEGVTIAVVDNGVELTHRDLNANQAADLHFDFELGTPTGGLRPTALNPTSADQSHGTAGTGLAVAALDGVGIAGVAPKAKFASWIIYPTNAQFTTSFIAPEKLAQMFQYASNRVDVQLHNWVENITLQTVAQTEVESLAISNAVTFGRNGKGVVMVRAAGNLNLNPNTGEYFGRNAGDDSHTSDPRAIAVAAVRNNGRVASYSEHGACILVGAPSGDLPFGFPNIFTTDRTGTAGYNPVTFFDDPILGDYVFASFGFTGTSAAAPQIAGLCALILSANPNLTYRDVQQILIHSSRHLDSADPDIRTNGVGYRVSHHMGFGLPDAGEAVRLADAWTNRPATVVRVIPSDIGDEFRPIEDASLRVTASDLVSVPILDQQFIAFPSLGPQPDEPTPSLPLVDVGTAEGPITQDLTGKGALIKRRQGGASFPTKLGYAAAAGAEFSIVYNDEEGDGIPPLLLMRQTDFVPIPAVFIRKSDGETLQSYITNRPLLRVKIGGSPTVARFNVTESLLCEHIGLRIGTTHGTRQDLRVTLVSPMGTRSTLQKFNLDQTPLGDWTFYSTQHFYEQAQGEWRLEVTDLIEESDGELTGAELIVHGVPIEDSDRDGLDDIWERANFAGSLAQGPLADPDNDGSWNAREQVLGTNPNSNQAPFKLAISKVQTNIVRVAFPSVEGTNYVVRTGTTLNPPIEDVATIRGDFGETEITSDLLDPKRFFQIRKQ